uniref:Alcohol dehydrogenase N-terminal domain-containing protein n=1 Tax=Pygocentrus nattereri TaxID=42514 RepID=A0AAR2M1L5_PYGNA
EASPSSGSHVVLQPEVLVWKSGAVDGLPPGAVMVGEVSSLVTIREGMNFSVSGFGGLSPFSIRTARAPAARLQQVCAKACNEQLTSTCESSEQEPHWKKLKV